MKRFFVILFTFIICLFLIFLIYRFSISDKENDNLISINNKIEENITEIVDENILEETSQEERKISYKATIILNKYYKDCNHTITSSVEVPYDMVNMSKEDNQIFRLYYYSGMKVKEIALKLNISEVKVKTKLFRIRQKIRKNLEERGYRYE